MLGRYDERELVARLSELGPLSATAIVKRLPDGTFDGALKIVAKRHELPQEIVDAAQTIARWTGATSVLVVCNKDGLDRLEWPRRL